MKSFKAILLVSIFFCSLFIVAPPANSKIVDLGLINLSSVIDIGWNVTEEQETIIPRGRAQKIAVDVTYNIAAGGGLIFPSLVNLFARLYEGTQMNVKLEIIEEPTWAEVSLSNYDVTFIIDQDHLPETKKVIMTITLDQDAPGYLLGEVRIKVSVNSYERIFIPDLIGFEKTFSLSFTPEYLPLVDARTSATNSKKIGPMDTAIFPIYIENKGNERTTVFLTVNDIPSGWTALVTDTVTLETNQSATVYLSIQPPRGLGYHYDIETFVVSVVPARANNIAQRGEERPVSVQVESNGFSIVGIEFLLIPLAIIIAIIIFLYYYYRYRPKITK
jgi:hypothetical protein